MENCAQTNRFLNCSVNEIAQWRLETTHQRSSCGTERLKLCENCSTLLHIILHGRDLS